MSGVAAVPAYIAQNFKDVPPGHRFGLYLQLWDAGNWSIKENPKREPSEKYQALNRLVTLSHQDKQRLEAMQARQRSMADGLIADERFYLPATSSAPFLTGTGMEHPLENGFAFLNPYGLPYLPGSSIKGVLRRAAEELALELYGESSGWTPLMVWWLFGFEPVSVYITREKPKDRDKMPDELLETAEHFRERYHAAVGRMIGEPESLRAFIEIAPGKDGLCHISELSDGFVKNVTDICKMGDMLEVKVIAVDDQNRVKLSRKAVLAETGGDDNDDDDDDFEDDD